MTVEERDQLEDLVARFQAPLRSYFRKRINSASDIDDLVQTLFLRLLDRDSQIPLENSEAYIFQTAANLLRDRYRRGSTREKFLQNQQFLGPRSEEISPERVLVGKDELASVQRALMELPERTRTIFVLHRFEQFKYREIAERLGISASAVEKHIASAIAHIFLRVGKER